MALLDDLVQFVSGNTLNGSWQKPQLKQRCEKFLEDADIGGGGDMPDKVTVAMMESVEWPELVEVVPEGEISVSYFTGENVDEILGVGESNDPQNCSYEIVCNIEGSANFICTLIDQGVVTYSRVVEGDMAGEIIIERHDHVSVMYPTWREPDNYAYDAESDTYIYDGGK